MQRIVVLISGRGSNLAALLGAQSLGGRIVKVISNRGDAGGLALAKAAGVETEVIEHTAFAARADFDQRLLAAIAAATPDWVVLAGFMRVLGEAVLAPFAGRMLNIHPSLLPAFPGLHTHQRALDAGCRIHGCTVHFVTPTLDHGPIIAQAALPVFSDDTAESLAARVLAQEHPLLIQAVRDACAGRLEIAGQRVSVRERKSA